MLINIRAKLATLKAKLFLTAVSLIVISLISIGIFSYNLFSVTIFDRIDENSRKYNTIIGEGIQTLVTEATDYCNRLLVDDQMNDYMARMTDYYNGLDSSNIVNKLYYRLSIVLESRKEIEGISIITEKFNMSRGNISDISYEDLKNEGLLAKLDDNRNISFVMEYENNTDALSDELDRKSIYIVGQAENEAGKWIILLKLNPEFYSINEYTQEVVIGSSNNLIWTNSELKGELIEEVPRLSDKKTDGHYTFHVDNTSYYIVYNISSENNWIYVNITNLDTVKESLRNIIYFMLIITFLLFVVSVGLSYFISSKMVKPLKVLLGQIRNIHDFKDSDAVENKSKIGSYWLNKIKFRNKLIIFYSTLILSVSCILLSLFYLYSSGVVLRQFEQSAVESVDQAAKNIEFIIDNSECISSYISINESIQRLLMSGGSNDYLSKNVSEFLIREGFLKQGISYINLYGVNWERLYSTGTGEEYLDSITDTVKESFRESTYSKQWLKTKRGLQRKFSISFIRKVRLGLEDDKRYSVIGYIDVGTDEKFIEEKYSMVRWSENSRTFIVDAKDTIISAVDKRIIGKTINEIFPGIENYTVDGLKNGVFELNSIKMNVISAPISKFKWRLISLIPQREMLWDYINILTSNIVLLFVIIVLMLEIINIVIDHVTRPLYMIRNSINEIKMGNLDIELKYNGHDEFALLARDFKEMIGRLNNLFEEIYQGKLREKDLENRKKEAQLLCLQHQINPHFLYNTISSVKFLVKMGDRDEAVEMLKMMGKMFRNGIYRGQAIIGMQEEFEHVRSYLSLQQLRYKEKLSVQWEADEEIFEYKTLKFILQPVVENAVYHGIEVQDKPGIIVIRGRKDGLVICLEVEDNGLGMTDEKLKSINEQLQGKGSVTGIGLKNIDERIKMYFGNEYGLNIRSMNGKGTLVKVALPAIIKDKNIIGIGE